MINTNTYIETEYSFQQLVDNGIKLIKNILVIAFVFLSEVGLDYIYGIRGVQTGQI